MKKKVFLGTLAAMIFSIHISAFAAPAAAFGDVSAGNHIAAPYAKSDIIVPRPSASKYAALQKYAYIGIPADVKGHWAEKYLTYFLQAGCMDGSAAAFHPNEPITYAALLRKQSGKPVEFNGGTVSHKVFRDAALWDTAYPNAQAALICGEAGVWGNPSEANYTMLGYSGFCLQDQVQRQYIASFLVSMLPMQEKERVSEQQFADEIRFQSALCKDAMKRLTGENIISCYADGTIRPEGTVTKAELAAMLYKVMEKSQFDRNIVSDNLYEVSPLLG
ncbi:MAG: S-layer homology domain-containing protein [Anaerotignum faecicola]